MDWDTLQRTRYSKIIERLTFQPRPARCFSISGGTIQEEPSPTQFLVQDLPDEASLQAWLTQEQAVLADATKMPGWSLTVLALLRGPPNEFELRKEGALDQLWNVGCTQQHFEEIMNLSNISKAFPDCFDRDSSLVYSKHSTLRNADPEQRCLDIIMRSDDSNLQDLAFGLRFDPRTARTFVVIHGCTEKAFKELGMWLPAMKGYARHPLLMVNLFFELHRRRVHERYMYLRVGTTNLSFEVFGLNDPEVPLTVIEHQKSLVNSVTLFSEQIGVVGNDLTALRLRLADIKLLCNEIGDESDQARNQLFIQDGIILSDNLTRLDQRIQSLQADNANMRANTELLLPSIFNVIAMKDSQLNKAMASAARRDSSVMVGITVGTLTFFPCTTIATIFAMPVFDWNAALGENVTDGRFWIYLAVTIPLTTITLLILAIWLTLADKASKEFLTVREYIRSLSLKGFVQNERRRIAAKFKNKQTDEREKVDSMSSHPEP